LKDERAHLLNGLASANGRQEAAARLSRSLLMTWRRAFRSEPMGAGIQQSGFVRAVVATAAAVAAEPDARANGRMVIEIGKDRRVIVDAGVDAAALARVLAILERR
jgi:transposase